jgi:hypothetical protein
MIVVIVVIVLRLEGHAGVETTLGADQRSRM